MPHLTAADAALRFKINPRTLEIWVDRGYIHAFSDQHGVIRYSTEEIELGFVKYGPRRMRDGRKRRGVKAVPIVVPEAAAIPEVVHQSAGHTATGEPRTVQSVNDAPEGR